MIPTRLTRIDDVRLTSVSKPFIEIWTTLEGENPGGSIKDRMVFYELSEALARGEIKAGDTVSEISAGSTALSLAFYARHFRLRCILFVPKDIDQAAYVKLKRLSAELHLVDPTTAYADYEIFCKAHSTWRLDQMKRVDLRNHYTRWVQEDILGKIPKVDLIVGAVGTGHSLLGVGAGFEPGASLITAEPVRVRLIHGIRNLNLESLGADEPCDRKRIKERTELDESDFFPDSIVSSLEGQLTISDSFRVVLGAVDHLAKKPACTQVEGRTVLFAVGTHNRVRNP